MERGNKGRAKSTPAGCRSGCYSQNPKPVSYDLHISQQRTVNKVSDGCALIASIRIPSKSTPVVMLSTKVKLEQRTQFKHRLRAEPNGRRCRRISIIPSPTECDNNNGKYKCHVPGPKHTSWRHTLPLPPWPGLKIRKNTPRTRPLIAVARCRSQPCTSPQINSDHNTKVTTASDSSSSLSSLLLRSHPAPSFAYSRKVEARATHFLHRLFPSPRTCMCQTNKIVSEGITRSANGQYRIFFSVRVPSPPRHTAVVKTHWTLMRPVLEML